MKDQRKRTGGKGKKEERKRSTQPVGEEWKTAEMGRLEYTQFSFGSGWGTGSKVNWEDNHTHFAIHLSTNLQGKPKDNLVSNGGDGGGVGY